MISSSLTHLRNVATSTTVPSTLWPLKPLNMANFYGKSDQNTIGHSGALGGKAMYVVFWFVFFVLGAPSGLNVAISTIFLIFELAQNM